MSKEEQPIIIKRIKKTGHGGHHGGAWKVAYADFVTAMMAFFLVLWLIAMLSIETKRAVAEYFRSYTIFKGSEAGGGKGISLMQGGPVKLDKEPGDIKRGVVLRERLALELGKIVEERLHELKEQILIFTTNEGVRVELVERDNNPMFELGKANLLPTGTKALQIIAGELKDMPNSINIEGHTDRRQYPDLHYTNWELAADRANAARRELIKNGLDPRRITKVTSFADVIPINTDNPYDAINRRISILVVAKMDSH